MGLEFVVCSELIVIYKCLFVAIMIHMKA